MLHETEKCDSQNKVAYFLAEHKLSKFLKPVVMEDIENFIRNILFEKTLGIRSVNNSLWQNRLSRCHLKFTDHSIVGNPLAI